MVQALAAAILCGGIWGQYVPDRPEFLTDTVLRPLSLQRYWQAELPLPTGDSAEQAWRVDDQLYVTSRAGHVVALHAPTGIVLWVRNLSDGLIKLYAPTHLVGKDGPGPVVLVTERRVALVDRLTGEMVKEFVLPLPASTPAVGDGEMLYVGGGDGKMHALRWRNDAGVPYIRQWQVQTKGTLHGVPAFDGDNLFFGSTDGQFHSCKAYNKVLRWTFTADGPISTRPVLYEDGVIVAAGDRMLYRIDAYAGTRVWRRPLPFPLRDDPVVAGGVVYQPCPRTGLYAVEADTGEIRWQQEQARRFVARGAKGVFVLSDRDDVLLLVDEQSGEIQKKLNLFGGRAVVSNSYDDSIYAVSPQNQAVCLRSVDVPYLTFEEMTKIRARLLKGDGESASE